MSTTFPWSPGSFTQAEPTGQPSWVQLIDVDGWDDPKPGPGGVEVGFEANLGCWIFQGLPPGPAGLVGTDLPGGVRLVVDVAQPERLRSCQVRAGTRLRPDAAGLRLVEAILGPEASRFLGEGRV